MLMCDVTQERNAQVKLRQKKKKAVKVIENQWNEMEQQIMDEHDEKQRGKLEEDYKKKMAHQNTIQQQLHDFKLGYIKTMQEEMLEGELIKKQVEEDLEAERMKELDRKRAEQIRLAELKVANDQMREEIEK